MSETVDTLYVNGINAATGQYLVPPLTMPDVAAIIRGDAPPAAPLAPATPGASPAGGGTHGLAATPTDNDVTGWLRRVWRTLTQPHLGLPRGVDPGIVAEAGWGIVFHEDESEAVKRALEPLVAHRRTRVRPDRCHVLDYKTGQRRRAWLASYDVASGSVLPDRIPYYLLFVGGPEQIPFSFCHELDVEYAVGCLHLDSPADYERYARSVVDYETSAAVPNARTAVFFGPRHDDDGATQLSADELIAPLSASPPATFGATTFLAEEARKEALIDALCPRGGKKPPAIALTASHGMGWEQPDPRQLAEQGALICQDWAPFTTPGPADYFAASDVPADGCVHGLVAFHFACYGAGTPGHDRFLHKKGQPPPAIADRPFIAALPKALLAHPNGGALAVIGHVERAWGYSIRTPIAGAQLLPFRNTIDGIASGVPVGHAMKDFNERYAALSTSLANLLEELGFGATVNDAQLARAWVERNDAEGYLLLGDPAVSVRVDVLLP